MDSSYRQVLFLRSLLPNLIRVYIQRKKRNSSRSNVPRPPRATLSTKEVPVKAVVVGRVAVEEVEVVGAAVVAVVAEAVEVEAGTTNLVIAMRRRPLQQLGKKPLEKRENGALSPMVALILESVERSLLLPSRRRRR